MQWCMAHITLHFLGLNVTRVSFVIHLCRGNKMMYQPNTGNDLDFFLTLNLWPRTCVRYIIVVNNFIFQPSTILPMDKLQVLSTCYDPSFLLPVFSYILAPGMLFFLIYILTSSFSIKIAKLICLYCC